MSADSQQNLSPQIDNLVHDGPRGVGVVKLGPRRPPVAGARIRTATAELRLALASSPAEDDDGGAAWVCGGL